MSNLALLNQTRHIGEHFLAQGMIDQVQLWHAVEHQRQTGQFLGEALVELGFIPAQTVGKFLEEVTGFPFVLLSESPLNKDLARAVPEYLARRKWMLPFAESEYGIHVAMADPQDLTALDDLRDRLNRRIVPFLALRGDIFATLDSLHTPVGQAQSVLEEISHTAEAQEPEISVDDLVVLSEDAPIVRLVNGIVQSAINQESSDIHIEPREHLVYVRYRQDGLLREEMTIPRAHLPAIVSRIKVMSHLNIAERRRPQDGRFVFKSETGSVFDVRVSVLPLIHGEKIVMRLLAKTSVYGSADKLGLFPEQQELFASFILRPHGIMLVTGPTGSGKSTTLYAALSKINDAQRNINTVEDPVEYNIEGVNQVQVFPQIGMTFAAGLRSLLRQDPDVVMVGEIRDRETAEIAVQAALTGHLVLSTLHTNDAPGAVTRLINMGVEPFLIASALIGVVGQRLLRTVCAACKESHSAPDSIIEAFGLQAFGGPPPMLAEGRGCPRCGGSGMKGRTGAYELMTMSDTLRSMVLRNCASTEIREQAIAEGMMTMRDCALRKVLQGITTAEEVTRVLFSEN